MPRASGGGGGAGVGVGRGWTTIVVVVVAEAKSPRKAAVMTCVPGVAGVYMTAHDAVFPALSRAQTFEWLNVPDPLLENTTVPDIAAATTTACTAPSSRIKVPDIPPANPIDGGTEVGVGVGVGVAV